MHPNIFSWNKSEQNAYIAGSCEIPSKHKIKITDCSDKRTELELILFKLPHQHLAKWAIENAEDFISFINIGDENLKRCIIQESKDVLSQRIAGTASAYTLRQAGFLANTLSQKSTNDLSKCSAKVFSQAIATGHMRAHAIVSSDYAIKVINLLLPDDINKVKYERNKQIKTARLILEAINNGDNNEYKAY